jgi:hypothetical protein
MQVAIPVDLAELLLRFEHAGGDPPKRHLARAPPLDVAARVPRDRDHRLDRVRRLERAKERVWKPETGDGEGFLKAFEDRGGGTGMGRLQMRQPLPLVPAGRAVVPEGVEWLSSEVLKTRVAHGYCSPHRAAGVCPYANICETCDNFVPAPEFAPILESQLAEVRALQDDAAERGWEAEVVRHGWVIESLEGHLGRLQKEGGDPAAVV